MKVYLLNFLTQGLEFAYMWSSACLHMVCCLPNMEICDKNDDLRSVIWGRECFQLRTFICSHLFNRTKSRFSLIILQSKIYDYSISIFFIALSVDKNIITTWVITATQQLIIRFFLPSVVKFVQKKATHARME